MQIIASLDVNHHAHILAYIICSQFSVPRTAHLIVDTGSTNTTLLSDDVTRLPINCENLQLSPTPCITANGTITPYLLPNADLTFEAKYGWLNRNQSLATFHLNNIHCMPPTQPQLLTHQRIQHTRSLLGMDILRYFKNWKFTERELILETV